MTTSNDGGRGRGGGRGSKIQRVVPFWYDGYVNRPVFRVLFDRVPGYTWSVTPEGTASVIYNENHGIYLATSGAYATFFATDGRPSRGFGGRQIDILLQTDNAIEHKTFKGGWSSRAAVASMRFPKTPVIDCAYKTLDDGSWQMESGGYMGACLQESLVRYWYERQHYLDWGLALVEDGGEVTLEPLRDREYLKLDISGGPRVVWMRKANKYEYREGEIDEEVTKFLLTATEAYLASEVVSSFGGEQMDASQMQVIRN